MKTQNQVLITAKHLFNLFKVFFLKKQHRASECTKQQDLLEKLRRLPQMCPQGNR